jgi:hypothetical protein
VRSLSLLLVAGCDLVLGLRHFPPVDSAVPCNATLTPGDYSMTAIVFPNEVAPTLTMDETVMYMAAGGTISYSHDSGSWSAPTAAATLDDPLYYEDHPSLSYDGKALFFTRHLSTGGYDLPYEAHQVQLDTWAPATPIEFPSALVGNDVVFGVPTMDGMRVVASHGLTNHYHLAELARAGTTWSVLDTTGALYPVGGDVSDTSAQLAPDGCWMVFSRRDNAVINPDHDLMLTTRGADGMFGPAVRLFTNASPLDNQHPWVSPDGATVYFAQDTGLYVAHRQ